MDVLGIVPPGPDELCEQCLKVDFEALFRPDMKAFWLGTLATIMGSDACPFCRLVVHAISDCWRERVGDVWSITNTKRINVWVKTTLWAHCDSGREKELPSSKSTGQLRNAYLRFRPALGTDWVPEERMRSSFGTPRFTLCELDRLSSKKCLPFPRDPQRDGSQVLQRRPIPEVAEIPLIRSWVDECQGEHGHSLGGPDLQTRLRATGHFRVIDVVESCIVEPTDDIVYIALSYIWGDALRERQTAEPSTWWRDLFEDVERDQRAEPPRRLRFDKIPATIQDASELVKSIGRRYLWVDLLCIDQDDLSEKEVLIKHMHLLYEGASFTIVAAGGKSAESRLHGLHKSTRSPEKTCVVPTKSGELGLVIARPGLSNMLSSTDWNTRGWTFQEDVLSSCCLYFTSNEIFYSCRYHSPQSPLPSIEFYRGFGLGRFSEWREGYVLETKYTKTAYQSTCHWNDGWSRLPIRGLRSEARVICQPEGPGQDGGNNVKDIEFSEYAAFIREYTKRNLTKPGDIVTAFMGVLHKFGTKLSLGADVEFHGLLDNSTYDTNLEKALLWTPGLNVALNRRHIKPAPGQIAPRQLPSWAWSGWVGPVEYLIEDDKKTHLGWNFWPVVFSPRGGHLLMSKLFRWSSLGDRQVFGWSLKVGDRPVENLEQKTSAPSSSCTLTLLKYVADVKGLVPGSEFVAQKYDTRTNHPICVIRFNSGNSTNSAAVLLDSWTSPIGFQGITKPEKYKLVHIGQGRRMPPPGLLSPATLEWTALLVEQKGDYYERVGLTAIPTDQIEGSLQWISIL
ncbi:HET-domain-containing protein [Acephala macrosclerotiorum]|nr:HET-domain-containing protein [Acephala macrosclerotiorum]